MIEKNFPGRRLEVRQNFFWGVWFCALSALPMQAQTIPAPERLALVDLSGGALTRAQSQAMIAALAQICREENNFAAVTETALAAYLKKRRHFSVLSADSVRALCQNLGADYLIALKFDRLAAADSPSAPAWQITMRWLDGNTGQITKTLVREGAGEVDAPEVLPLREMFLALLESPEVILPVDNLPVEMPALAPQEMEAPPMDNAATITPLLQNRRGRHWLWYFTGAAVLGGGSTLLLLRKPPGSAPAGKPLLPEPPDPPK
jgi:hypothetical protein